MKHQAIYNTHPEVKSIHDNSGAFDIDGNSVDIDEDLVSQEILKLQAEYKAIEYQRKRAQAYPSIADQLDTIFHTGIDGWKEQIQTVKDKYPKEVV